MATAEAKKKAKSMWLRVFVMWESGSGVTMT